MKAKNQLQLSLEETRLIAVRRAIEKFGNPEIVSVEDASLLYAYIDNLVSLAKLEQIATEDNLEYFLDGFIVGIGASKMLQAGMSPEEAPEPKLEAAKQFQTGVSTDGEVRVNKT